MDRLVFCTVLIALIAGCKDSSAPATIDGSYPLRTYRDLPLPAIVSEVQNHSVQIVSGTITINDDVTFSVSYTFDVYDNGVYAREVVACTGRWASNGESPQGGLLITLVESSVPAGCGDRGTAEWDHNKRMTIAWNALGLTQHRR